MQSGTMFANPEVLTTMFCNPLSNTDFKEIDMVYRFLLRLILVMVSVLGSGTAVAEDTGKTVLVTGANRGIGLEFVRQLKAQGYVVIGTARKPDEADDLNAMGVRVEQLDVTDDASVDALADSLKGVRIDLLINNAGIGGHNAGSFRETNFDEIARTFDVNSLGPMRVTQALLDNLDAGEGKTIVHISSIMGSIESNRGGFYGYRASKAALNMFNKSLSVELGKQGYISVVIHPGWVKTRMGGAAAPVELADSVAGMLKVIQNLGAADNGRFIDYQGNGLPW
jgi:NAD(P)-dependent dehydrogenase (short-subunit alcohol dehydrogenase family)